MTEAILLVGGQGTRLRPVTVHTPKPMVPAAGVPFLAHQLARLAAAGVDHVVMATCYLAEVFEPHFGDGSAHGLSLEYVVEDEPLGTGGAIRHAARRLRGGPDRPVLVLNGDILSGVDIRGLVAAHRERGADVTLHLTRVEDPRAFGLVPTDADGRVLAFTEKPQTPEEIVTDQVNAGAYVFTRSVIDTIPEGRAVSVERETFPGLLARGAYLHGHAEDSYWLDLGRPEALVQASADLVRGVVDSPAVPGERGESLVLPGAEVAADALLAAGTVVGAGARIGAGALVHGSVVLDGAEVGEGADVRRSLVGAGARIGRRTVLDGAVVGDGARVGADNELRTGARVWCEAVLPDAVLRFSPDDPAAPTGRRPQTTEGLQQ
ncbi:sugar phosphate nucleotidyltransferase [Streptomyces sp. NPDC002564]|uniref:sugar phosphate nucleotidyltransferase n=1 Tax=Streptomyces sp. NPDC002564 TaxID=3364649 RepID=UPI0036CF5761